MTTLKVYISGLCVMVPEKEKQQLTFLFPDVSNEKLIKQQITYHKKVIRKILKTHLVNGGGSLPKTELNAMINRRLQQFKAMNLKPHKNVLMFSEKNLVSDYPDYPYFLSRDHEYWGLWELDHHDVSVANATGNLQYQDKYLQNPPDDLVPNDQNRHDTGFIAPMRTRAGTLRKVKSGLVASEIRDRRGILMSRFLTTSGHLTNVDFSFDQATNKYYLYELDGKRQAIASLICLNIDLNGPEAYLQASHFNDKTKNRILQLKPLEGKQVIEVFLLNSELDEILGYTGIGLNQELIANRFIQEYIFLQRVLVRRNAQSTTPIFDPNHQGGPVISPLPRPNLPWGMWMRHPGENVPSGNCKPAIAGA